MLLQFRIEEVAFNRRDGQAKVLGIVLCVSGATILTLYKGPAIFGDPTSVSPLPGTTVSLGDFLSVLQGWEIDRWRLGALCLISNSFLSGVFVNLQVTHNSGHQCTLNMCFGMCINWSCLLPNCKHVCYAYQT